MAYADRETGAERPAAIAGVAAVHVAIAALLVVGLKTIVPVITPDPPLTGETITMPLPPPPPTPDAAPTQANDLTPPQTPRPHAPAPPITFPTFDPGIITDPILGDPGLDIPGGGTIGGIGGGADNPGTRPKPDPGPTYDPVVAQPRGDAANWVTRDDYRSSWIAREMVGTARFRLEIDSTGKVTHCQITRTSGHDALDEATCRLVSRRAKFTPARDASGARVTGTYSNAVTWQLPE